MMRSLEPLPFSDHFPSGPHHSATAASAMKLTAAQLDLALRRMVFLDLPLETGSLNSPPGV